MKYILSLTAIALGLQVSAQNLNFYAYTNGTDVSYENIRLRNNASPYGEMAENNMTRSLRAEVGDSDYAVTISCDGNIDVWQPEDTLYIEVGCYVRAFSLFDGYGPWNDTSYNLGFTVCQDCDTQVIGNDFELIPNCNLLTTDTVYIEGPPELVYITDTAYVDVLVTDTVYIEVPADSAFCIQYLEEAYDDGWNDGYELATSQCDENTCPADLNQDGAITTSDLLAFLSVFSLSCDELD